MLNQSIDTLSKGYKHRTCLAQALVPDPEVLIMDEPTDGLDPNQKHEVRKSDPRARRQEARVFPRTSSRNGCACTRADHHRPRQDRGERHSLELRNMSDLAGAVTLQARGATAERLSALGRWKLNGPSASIPKTVESRQLARKWSSSSPARLEGRGHVQRARRARRSVPTNHAPRPGEK